MKKIILKTIPWLITAVACYLAFGDLDWDAFFNNLKQADPAWLVLAVFITILSYLFRARRWQVLFPEPVLNYINSGKVLILGFFMNNILPARTGELVRAHVGSKVTGEKRTLVLGTIASERLADGLTISVMFVLFGFHLGSSENLDAMLYVSWFFAAAVAMVIFTLLIRERIFKLLTKIAERINHKAGHYASDRVQTFIHSLSPLCNVKKIPAITLWSVLIWSTELLVYICVSESFGADLSIAESVLFLAAVNFSSLIPAAPGGIGVIEAVASAVLVSAGVPKELALPMVMSQHIIQMLVVGIPGAMILSNWKVTIDQATSEDDE